MAKALLDGADLKLGLFSANCSSGMAVTKIEDRWFASSGKTPESRVVELGGNRAVAAAPLKDPATFNKMPESEPKQLDWLPGTTQEQKNEIERLVKDLFDDKHPAKLSKASTALATIGKPAIPALINQFSDWGTDVSIDVPSDDETLDASQLLGKLGHG